MTTNNNTVNWERAFEPLRTEPIMPTDQITYSVTLRQSGDQPQVLARVAGLDSLQSMIAVSDLLPGARCVNFDELRMGHPYVAIHRHQVGEGFGTITPVLFFQ